ncbi:hypothetical protein G7Y89_g8398 [Cudoniella acicularis]|uniref:Uncharacterized protein n=1 Tax=Cudoniella acicularis TaxID=354080 RepID=A0A8H4W3L2_9HELO|nr:hypothetical protein G7Y89_g8398 [Cudoniella acicularis]
MAVIKLEGGFALITGAASGIGKETAFTFAESGAAGILLADIDESNALVAAEDSKKLAVDPAYRAIAIHVDVTNADSVNSMVAYAVKEFGRIDYCVNSAGVSIAIPFPTDIRRLTLQCKIDISTYFIPFSNSSVEDYDKVMRVNAKGTFLVTQAALKQMSVQEPRDVTTTRNRTRSLGRGTIVNVASVLSFGAIPQKVAYIASKHAVLGITKVAALEGGPLGIRVNCVCPAWVRTAMFVEECTRAPHTADIIKAMISQGRPAEPEEVSESIGFLCSAAGSYITGVGFIIDAGLTLTAHLG